MRSKNIVIIGGNTGIGKVILEKLTEMGAQVYNYSSSGEGDHKLDITEDFDVIPNLPEVIDGLVYCPGTISLKPFHRFTIEDFQKDYNVNVLGAVRVLQACL